MYKLTCMHKLACMYKLTCMHNSCIYKEYTIIIMYNLCTSTFIFFLFYAVAVGYVFAC